MISFIYLHSYNFYKVPTSYSNQIFFIVKFVYIEICKPGESKF